PVDVSVLVRPPAMTVPQQPALSGVVVPNVLPEDVGEELSRAAVRAQVRIDPAVALHLLRLLQVVHRNRPQRRRLVRLVRDRRKRRLEISLHAFSLSSPPVRREQAELPTQERFNARVPLTGALRCK